MHKTAISNLLTKTGINLFKTTSLLLASNILTQQLKNSTKDTNETLAQSIRYWRNKTSRA